MLRTLREKGKSFFSQATDISPARHHGESFTAYKIRRAKANAYCERVMRGRLIWVSVRPRVIQRAAGGMKVEIIREQGTYRRG